MNVIWWERLPRECKASSHSRWPWFVLEDQISDWKENPWEPRQRGWCHRDQLRVQWSWNNFLFVSVCGVPEAFPFPSYARPHLQMLFFAFVATPSHWSITFTVAKLLGNDPLLNSKFLLRICEEATKNEEAQEICKAKTDRMTRLFNNCKFHIYLVILEEKSTIS